MFGFLSHRKLKNSFVGNVLMSVGLSVTVTFFLMSFYCTSPKSTRATVLYDILMRCETMEHPPETCENARAEWSGMFASKTLIDDEVTLKRVVADSGEEPTKYESSRGDMPENGEEPQTYNEDAADFPDPPEMPKVISKRRYLFPMQTRGLGPSVQYESFKLAAAFAKQLNRSIVLVPFFHHRGHEEASSRPFAMTYDADVLKNTVSVANVREFMKDCDNTISVALQAPQIGGRPAEEYNTLFHKEKETLDSIFGITMPGPETIPKSKEHTLQMIADSENVPCVGLYFPLDFASLINSDVLLLEVEKGLARPPPMKEMADVVMGNICESGPFATVHWRNKSGEICTAGARSGSIDPATCTKKINYLAKAANLLPEAIMHAVNEYNIQCLYIAHPPYARKIDELLKGKLPRVFSRSDILANVDLANGPFSQIKDEYYMSLLEQEMCARSDVFLSCRKSAWSRVVRNEREAHGRISIFLADLPGIPPEFTNLI